MTSHIASTKRNGECDARLNQEVLDGLNVALKEAKGTLRIPNTKCKCQILEEVVRRMFGELFTEEDTERLWIYHLNMVKKELGFN